MTIQSIMNQNGINVFRASRNPINKKFLDWSVKSTISDEIFDPISYEKIEKIFNDQCTARSSPRELYFKLKKLFEVRANMGMELEMVPKILAPEVSLECP